MSSGLDVGHFSPVEIVHDSNLKVIGEQALVDILDRSKVVWTCWGCFYTSSGLGLRMVKKLGLQLALGMNDSRKLASCLCIRYHVCVRILDRPKVEPAYSNFVMSFRLQFYFLFLLSLHYRKGLNVLPLSIFSVLVLTSS